MADGDKKDVFISYSTRNSELAQFFCNQLEGTGISCWIAPRDIPAADEWASAIVKGLDATSLVALLVSEASMDSREVAKEIDLASNIQHTKIIPIRIENTLLKDAFRYHLSNKQWIDALGDDKQTRFSDAIATIRVMLNKAAVQVPVAQGSIIGKARLLVTQLNSKHGEQLGAINTLFSVREESAECISLFFPLRFGATGVDLIFKFSGETKRMEFYADAASDGDSLKSPFINLMRKHSAHYFPRLKVTKRARRWRFVEIVPETDLSSPLLDLSVESAFELFRRHIDAFSEKVLPCILDWAVYVVRTGNAIRMLEEELKNVFPKEEGWAVEAPERWRLDQFRPYGKISVYKMNWVPAGDEYQNKRLLSITLESEGAFLNNLYIGVMKHEEWMDLGEWEGRIRREGDALVGATEEPGVYWPWWKKLEGPFNCSGIGEGDLCWQDNLQGFVAHCLNKFTLLKGLEETLGQACEKMPALQDRDLDSFPIEARQWENGLYIRNWLKTITGEAAATVSEPGLTLDYRYRGRERDQDIRLRLQVGHFDAAILFRCSKNEMSLQVANLEPPFFETPIVRDYFATHYTNVKFENENAANLEMALADKELNGSEAEAWMTRFQGFVHDHLADMLAMMRGLKRHLEQVVGLTVYAEKELESVLSPSDGWIIENKAKDLDRFGHFAVYRESWKSNSTSGEYPALIFQIIPGIPCFDDLSLAVKYLGAASPDLERALGTICGACDFAFGKTDEVSYDFLWRSRFDEVYRNTGGRLFDRPLLSGEDKVAFGNYLRGIAAKLKQMEPIIASLCSKRNEMDFIVSFRRYTTRLAEHLKSLFPEEDGWEMQNDANDPKRAGAIRFFKKSWQKRGKTRGDLSFSVGGDSRFDNLYFGVHSLGDKYFLSAAQQDAIVAPIVRSMGAGKTNASWLWYKYAEEPFRTTGIADAKVKCDDDFEAMLHYYADVFRSMKEAAPDIDKVLSDEKSGGGLSQS